ncbi:hypothetical protein FRC02_005059, partial [Tulasnella sp. 418]
MDQPEGDLQRPALGSQATPLPPELLLTILEYMWDRDPQQLINLSNCSMVCSRWRPIAQALLFTEVSLDVEEKAECFLSGIRSNPLLGQATRLMALEYPSLRSYQVKSGAEAKANLIHDITALCPSLYRLKIELLPRMTRKMLKNLFHPRTFKTLQALWLEFDGAIWTHQVNINFNDILHFLYRFSSLSHLRLQNAHLLKLPDTEFRDVPPLPSFSLYEFSWINDDIFRTESIHGLFVAFSIWLFFKEGPYIITLLEEYQEAEHDMLVYFIEAHGANLVSMGVQITEEDLAFLSHDLRKACPNLRELILPSIVLLPPEFRSSFSGSLLEHVELAEVEKDLIDGAKAAATIDWVMSLPHIRYVTFVVDDLEIDNEYQLVKSFKEKCPPRVHLEVLPLPDLDEF